MKRVLIFLMAVLLLTGCTARQTTYNTEPTEPVAEFTKPSNLYAENSAIELQTAGAVKVYEPQETCTGIAAVNGKMVLVTDLSKLILMDSETGELGTAIKVGEPISTKTVDFSASYQGITYYREEGRELVFLSSTLEQQLTVEIPEGITGVPCVGRANEEVYYAIEDTLYAQNPHSSEVRLVFRAENQHIQLTQSHLNGTVLGCTLTDSEGMERQIYLKSATGELIDERILAVQGAYDQALSIRKDGIVEHLVYEIPDGEERVVNLEQPVHAAFEMKGGYAYAVTNGALELDFYDFAEGIHSAHIRLEGVAEPVSVVSDGKYLWILAEEGGTAKIFRWDVTMSPTEDKETVFAPLYTREKPDTEGLALCDQRAQELTDEYGIYVTVGENAMAVTGGYEVTEEYQVPALNRIMDELEEILNQFPEDFLQESLSEGSIHIGFVRGISGGREVVQFYEDSDAYILVAVTENFRQNILRGLAYVIDSHVLGNSTAYDDWKYLNPEEFEYDYSYYFYEDHKDSAYLTDADRAFVDAYAMTFPYEDRALLFAYAMMEGNDAYFTSDTMQAKLSAICDGIREAYGYEWSDETFLWEQYLATEESE